MPKRYGDLYADTFTTERLHAAYINARKGKRKTLAVRLFERDLGANLARLHTELHTDSYSPKPYRHFVVYGAKPRSISAPTFRDVVVQHAIYATIYPIFDSTFLKDSYGCRVGGGTHKASDALQTALRTCGDDSYILQLDVRKFYYRIQHRILRKLIEKKLKDRRLVDLMMQFVEDNNGPVGLPIGNLLSQLYALIYLNTLDHFIKRELRVRFYARYVDDLVLVLPTRRAAELAKHRIEEFISTVLNLEFSKWAIRPIRHGANFVGFRTWRSRRFIRKRSLHKFSKELRAGNVSSLISIVGNAKSTSTFMYFVRRLEDHPDEIQLPTKLQNYIDSQRRHNNGVRKNKRPDGRDIPIQHWRPASG